MLFSFLGFSIVISATTIVPQADAFVLSFSPDSNNGTSSLIVNNVASLDGSDNISLSPSRKSYLQFNLSSITDNVANASLNLVNAGSGGNPVSGPQLFNIFGLNDGVNGENWGEFTITWNNAPGNNTISRSEMNNQATLLGQFTIEGTGNAGDLIQFSGSSLDAFLNADTNGLATIIITRETFDPDPNGFIHAFTSREQVILGKPNLTFDEVSAIPEPSTMVFLSIAFLGLLMHRKILFDGFMG